MNGRKKCKREGGRREERESSGEKREWGRQTINERERGEG